MKRGRKSPCPSVASSGRLCDAGAGGYVATNQGYNPSALRPTTRRLPQTPSSSRQQMDLRYSPTATSNNGEYFDFPVYQNLPMNDEETVPVVPPRHGMPVTLETGEHQDDNVYSEIEEEAEPVHYSETVVEQQRDQPTVATGDSARLLQVVPCGNGALVAGSKVQIPKLMGSTTLTCVKIEESGQGPHGAIATLSGSFGGAPLKLELPAIQVHRLPQPLNRVPVNVNQHSIKMAEMTETGIINATLASFVQQLNVIDKTMRPAHLKFDFAIMQDCLRPVFGFTELNNISKFSITKKQGFKDLHSHWDPILGNTWDLLKRFDAVVTEMEFRIQRLGFSSGKLEVRLRVRACTGGFGKCENYRDLMFASASNSSKNMRINDPTDVPVFVNENTIQEQLFINDSIIRELQSIETVSLSTQTESDYFQQPASAKSLPLPQTPSIWTNYGDLDASTSN